MAHATRPHAVARAHNKAAAARAHSSYRQGTRHIRRLIAEEGQRVCTRLISKEPGRRHRSARWSRPILQVSDDGGGVKCDFFTLVITALPRLHFRRQASLTFSTVHPSPTTGLGYRRARRKRGGDRRGAYGQSYSHSRQVCLVSERPRHANGRASLSSLETSLYLDALQLNGAPIAHIQTAASVEKARLLQSKHTALSAQRRRRRVDELHIHDTVGPVDGLERRRRGLGVEERRGGAARRCDQRLMLGPS